MSTTVEHNTREQAIEGLRALADLLTDPTVPVPSSAVAHYFAGSAEEVRRFADAHELNLEISVSAERQTHTAARWTVGKIGYHPIDLVVVHIGATQDQS